MEKVYMYEGFKKYLNEISSPTYEDFIALCAMYYPGTLEKIPHYIARNAIYIGTKAETEANLLRRLECLKCIRI